MAGDIRANDVFLTSDTRLKTGVATVNGARALGLPGRIGQLSENSLADIITVPFAGKSADALEAVVHHACEVSASMIDGAWVIKPSTA